MSDKEKMKKAFQNLKAPEDTPERILEKMNQKENKRKPTVSRKCLTLAVTVASGLTVNKQIIIRLFKITPIKIQGLNFPAFKCEFSIIIPIIGSLMASHSRHTTIIADITAYWATVSFIVY